MSSVAAAANLSGEHLRTSAEPPSLWEFVQASGLRSLVIGASKDPNAKITVLLVPPAGGPPVLVAKVPTTDGAAAAVETERNALARLRRLPPELAATIPRVTDVVELDGRRGIVMTAVSGASMTTSYMRWRHTAGHDRVAAHFDAAGAWLADFQRATAVQPAPLDMDGGVCARLESRFQGETGLRDSLAALTAIHARLRRNEVPRTAVHGDLWFGNILLEGGRATGVVDWEGGEACGEPVRDLARFALMYALFLDRRTRAGRRVAGHAGLRAGSFGAGVEYALDGSGWFPTRFRQFLADGLERLGASPASWRDVALAGLAEVAALTDHPDFARHHLELFRRLT